MRLISIPYSLNSYNLSKTQNQPNFEAKGKPISLEYIVENRSNLLPPRVLEKAQSILRNGRGSLKSLKELHLEIYSPLLECKTLNEAKFLYKEFENMDEEVVFQRNSRYAEKFKNHTDKNFALKMLQEYWAKLRNKDDIAKELGMKNHTSLDWVLKQINFVGFDKNYKTLLKASDEEGNKIIASKTAAWNALHPDLMYAKNRKAAQGCKTDKYKKEQSQRIKDYDKKHPERREKIRVATQRAWDSCPEIKKAMSDYLKQQSPFIKSIVSKDMSKSLLTSAEKRIKKAFFKSFWDTHPKMREMYAMAMKNKV